MSGRLVGVTLVSQRYLVLPHAGHQLKKEKNMTEKKILVDLDMCNNKIKNFEIDTDSTNISEITQNISMSQGGI